MSRMTQKDSKIGKAQKKLEAQRRVKTCRLLHKSEKVGEAEFADKHRAYGNSGESTV